MYKIANIDKFGRISIPKKMRKILGLDESSTVYIEDKNHELIIRPVHKKNSDAIKKISEMELPVEAWDTMEYEIESGALSE
jgi:AbrB family looped-hinge helix DNA binding protein